MGKCTHDLQPPIFSYVSINLEIPKKVFFFFGISFFWGNESFLLTKVFLRYFQNL